MQLVHTEEVTGSIPVSPTRSAAMSISVEITMGAIPVVPSGQRAGTLPGHGGQARLIVAHMPIGPSPSGSVKLTV